MQYTYAKVIVNMRTCSIRPTWLLSEK